MNNNIKETTSLVFVKGKNLFDKNKIVAGYILAQDGSIAPPSASEASSDYIAIESSNPYTFSASNYTVPTGGSMWLAISLFDSNKNIIARYADYNINSITVTASQTVNAKYIRVSYRYNDSNIKCQLEYGSTATTYEAYINKEILVKNGNGVFEKFYSEDNLNHENYSLGEQKIGTWIGGETLYRKTVQVTNTSFVAGNNNIPHNIDNLKLCVKVEAVKNGTQILPYMNLTSDNKINTATFVTGVDSTNIILRIANDSWGTSNTWYFTLYYTKITD